MPRGEKISREEKLDALACIAEECKARGVTIPAACEKLQIKMSNYYRWKKELDAVVDKPLNPAKAGTGRTACQSPVSPTVAAIADDPEDAVQAPVQAFLGEMKKELKACVLQIVGGW